MTALESDLAPVYGPKTEHAAGMSRATLQEVMQYHRTALARLTDIVPGCVACAHKSGRVCRHYDATMPVNYDGRDCEAWAYDGIPL